MIDEKEALRLINEEGGDAYGLLIDADPNLERRFNRLNTAMIKLLSDAKKHFPDATYYTASGGFNLMLGQPHADGVDYKQQRELLALSGTAVIGDGDF